MLLWLTTVWTPLSGPLPGGPSFPLGGGPVYTLGRRRKRTAPRVHRGYRKVENRRNTKPLFTSGEQKRVGPFEIQGKKASDLEYTCYLALKELGWREDAIEFQVATLGGRNPGGSMIDFVLWTNAGPVVIEVDGDIWHITTEAQRQKGRTRQAAIEEAWGGKIQYTVLGTGDLTPDAVAYNSVLRAVGRGG